MAWVLASLYACLLLIVWAVGILAVIGLLWGLALLVGIAKYSGVAANALTPLASATIKTVLAMGAPLLVLGAIALVESGGERVPKVFPPEATAIRALGEQLFVPVFLVFSGVVVPFAYGLPLMASQKRSHPSALRGVNVFRWLGGMLLGVLGIPYPGTYAVFAAPLTFVYAAAIAFLTIRAIARWNFSSAPELEALDGPSGGRLVLVHISDVHVTARRGQVPQGGERSGLPELRSLCQDLAEGRLNSRFFTISGDLVDQGSAPEWEAALQPLLELKESLGEQVGVILAPGNHDLLPAYSPLGRLTAALLPSIFPEVDGERVRRYMEAAFRLEPALRAADGSPFAEALHRVQGPPGQLRDAWDRARDGASAALGVTKELSHQAAMNRVKRLHPDRAGAIEREFGAAAVSAYPDSTPDHWIPYLYKSGPHVVDEFGLSGRWQKCWYDLFPLRVRYAAEDVEFFILNSTPPTPRLAQSAVGKCGKDQLDRLEACFAARETGTALEINASPERLDLKDTHAYRARELGVPLVISTDSHHHSSITNRRFGVAVARRAWCEPKHILNTLPRDRFLRFIRTPKPERIKVFDEALPKEAQT